MEINCHFGDSLENIYWCRTRDANITEKDRLIKEFKGNHRPGKSHNDVQYAWFRQTTVNHFPRGLEKHFPNLIDLIITDGGIKKISKNDLKGLEGLHRLQIDNCQLSSLPDDLLTEMPNLRTVSFFNNKIEFASSNLLKPLIGRENVKVHLRYNKIIDACYWPRFPDSLGSLEELMKLIDEKCIKPTFVPDLVESDPKLKEMWLSEKFSDLTIIAGDKKFKVHKNILGMRSSELAQILRENEATEIKIADFSANSIEALLKFIYTDEISEDGNSMENFEIANKFKVDDMKSFFKKIIFDQLDNSNVEEIFMFAHRHSSQLLMEKAFHLIAEKFPELPVKLLEEPEKLKKLIDARRDLDELLEDK